MSRRTLAAVTLINAAATAVAAYPLAHSWLVALAAGAFAAILARIGLALVISPGPVSVPRNDPTASRLGRGGADCPY